MSEILSYFVFNSESPSYLMAEMIWGKSKNWTAILYTFYFVSVRLRERSLWYCKSQTEYFTPGNLSLNMIFLYANPKLHWSSNIIFFCNLLKKKHGTMLVLVQEFSLYGIYCYSVHTLETVKCRVQSEQPCSFSVLVELK